MDICKYIILDLTKRKLVVNKGKVGQGESFKLGNQTCKEKGTTSSKDLNSTESFEDLCTFFDDECLLTLTNIIKKRSKRSLK